MVIDLLEGMNVFDANRRRFFRQTGLCLAAAGAGLILRADAEPAIAITAAEEAKCGLLASKAPIGQTNQTAAPIAPAARNRPAIADDEARKQTMLFGGAARTKSAPDVREWDGKRWQQITP